LPAAQIDLVIYIISGHAIAFLHNVDRVEIDIDPISQEFRAAGILNSGEARWGGHRIYFRESGRRALDFLDIIAGQPDDFSRKVLDVPDQSWLLK